jgi:hypothetical protein
VALTQTADGLAAGTAGGRSHVGASHADREQVIGTLKAAFVQGRLAKDEFDLRVAQAFASRNYAELAVLTADLPAGLTDAAPPRRADRTQARPQMSNAAKAGICVAIAIAVPVVLSLATGAPIPFFIFPPFYLMVAVVEMLASRHEKRSRRGQLPPRPAQGGPAVEGGPDGQPGDDRILCQARRLSVLVTCRHCRVRGHCATGGLVTGIAAASW